MRRKQGAVLPLEAAILSVAVELARSGTNQFHGFVLAKHLRDAEGAATLTAHGTLYKALGRMEKAGLLTSRWEDPDLAVGEGRPRRRLYEITASGRSTLMRIDASRTAAADPPLDPGWSPS
jgi:PadR family transcriptional regulator